MTKVNSVLIVANESKIMSLQQKPTVYILVYIPPAIAWKLLVKVGKSLQLYM